MLKRQLVALFFTGTLLLFWARPAFAGGWATVTVDDLPHTLRAGEAITLGFIVRQHGVHPVNLENVVLTATSPEGESFTFTARQEGAVGHYWVDVTLPSAGEWAWEIQPDWFKASPLAPITVVGTAAPKAAVTTTALPNPSLSQLVSRIGTWVINWLFGVDSVMGATPQPAIQETGNEVAYGRAIFIAKGCNTCHLHSAALTPWSIGVGPDLTGYQLPADYLRAWLTDPKAVKPQTAMPNLALKAAEIEALIAFLPSSAQ